MKTAWGQSERAAPLEASGAEAPAIVELFGSVDEHQAAANPEPEGVLGRARAFATPLLEGERMASGEPVLAHAEGVAAILAAIGAAPSMRAAAFLVHAADVLAKPEEAIAKGWGEHYASLVAHTRRLVQAQRTARAALEHGHGATDAARHAAQTERVRKMLLAFSRDLRVVLLLLASRLETLRWHARSKRPCPPALAHESLQVFAPLANRLGIWPIKWELEDLAFRFTRPDDYSRIARLLDERRVEREAGVEAARERLERALRDAGIAAGVKGRPKHLYSIWKKMQGKQLGFERVLDLQALRVIVTDVPDCYAALACVHGLWRALPEEFDDYIARPKANGYRSLHTVVLDDAQAADGARPRPLEVQIRTAAMHEHAESGVAAHWAYKEAGASGAARDDALVAQARKAVLQQLLAWEHELAQGSGDEAAPSRLRDVASERVYVFTPQAEIVELSAGATPVDFAYAVHTSLGHRCRGARVDGALVPLNTVLASGQTVEITTVREGGPSLDWLNPELAILGSARSRAKVRAWFNALAQQQTVARGRDAVEKLLQREGRTAVKLDDLASQLGFRGADALFEVVGKDEFSLRNIENLLRPAEPLPDADEAIAQRLTKSDTASREGKGGVLVVGIDSLLTALARCCRPAPPDAIGGYVTRGKGVAVHRADCSNFREMVSRHAERRIPVAWSAAREAKPQLYPIDLAIEADDRQGLLRDITELFAKAQVNVTAMRTRSLRGIASMTFTVEVADTSRLASVLAQAARVAGVRSARRR
ncbi:MAG TPA: RelA/SpoT family protein [Methylibium sp.]|uniref:RelA/SpoT family protein n=1 Tax=Methylibium sp. TaxID=2067992 RepID=UPI002DBB22FE|nr:RelA/SpoT family protein [Methylibium sp.]HEU4457811.1 RelA/SpoT family protein [Methylibium sp.]